MGEIVNLRRARKQRARQRDELAATANRVAFGVGKATKLQARAERERAAQALEGHRRDGDVDDA